MAPIPNPRLIFTHYPSGYPSVKQHFQYSTTPTLDPDTLELNGGFLTKTLYLSADSYMRKLMAPHAPFGWAEGQVVEGFGVGEVVRSEMGGFGVGERVVGMFKFQAYELHTPESLAATPFKMRLIRDTEQIPLSAYLGIAGMPGKTAFYGLREIARPQPGESIFVSTAARGVGQLVCQLCKLWGLRVLACAGSGEKVRFLQDVLGVERAFDYKTRDVGSELEAFGGVDVYWDNVGGEMLDATLLALRHGGRVVVCGQTGVHNLESKEERYGIKNIDQMIFKELTMRGFAFNTYDAKYSDEFYATIPPLVREGKIRYGEEVVEGLERAAQGIVRVIRGENVGKVVVRVA